MAELVDATDLKSVGTLLPCRFDSGFPHHLKALENQGFFVLCVKNYKQNNIILKDKNDRKRDERSWNNAGAYIVFLGNTFVLKYPTVFLESF